MAITFIVKKTPGFATNNLEFKKFPRTRELIVIADKGAGNGNVQALAKAIKNCYAAAEGGSKEHPEGPVSSIRMLGGGFEGHRLADLVKDVIEQGFNGAVHMC